MRTGTINPSIHLTVRISDCSSRMDEPRVVSTRPTSERKVVSRVRISERKVVSRVRISERRRVSTPSIFASSRVTAMFKSLFVANGCIESSKASCMASAWASAWIRENPAASRRLAYFSVLIMPVLQFKVGRLLVNVDRTSTVCANKEGVSIVFAVELCKYHRHEIATEHC